MTTLLKRAKSNLPKATELRSNHGGILATVFSLNVLLVITGYLFL